MLDEMNFNSLFNFQDKRLKIKQFSYSNCITLHCYCRTEEGSKNNELQNEDKTL